MKISRIANITPEALFEARRYFLKLGVPN